jgi:hypothetical protein
MIELLEFLKEYGNQLSAVGALIAFLIGGHKYITERKESHFWKEFEVYHRLVKELVEPNSREGAMYVDRQTTIMFELRNFKRYHPYSLRMLRSLKAKWASAPNQFPRLIEEIDLTIQFLELKTK